MQCAMDRRADMISVLPVLDMKGFWENVIQPVCSGIMMIWFPPKKVNDPDRPHAYANGAFMMVRRDVYDRIGGHEAVRMCFNEDMHMADRLKKAGHRLTVVPSRGLYRVRMYTSLMQIVRGWARIFYGTFGTLKRLAVSLSLVVVMGLLPYPTAVLGFVLAAAGVAPVRLWLACGIVAATAVAMQVTAVYRFYRLVGARAALAWAYPLACGFASASLIGSLGKLRRGARTTWRDTHYTSSPA